MTRRSLRLVGWFVIICAGCGQTNDPWSAKRPKVVPAEGIVKYSGDPLVGATVVFSPVGETGVAALAITGADGRFQLMAFPPRKGAVPGQYKVAVTKLEKQPATKPAPSAEGKHDELPTPPPRHLIFERYSDPEKSGLSQDIPPEGRTDISITIN